MLTFYNGRHKESWELKFGPELQYKVLLRRSKLKHLEITSKSYRDKDLKSYQLTINNF